MENVMKALSTFLILIILFLLISAGAAQEPVETGSIFIEQCETVDSVTFVHDGEMRQLDPVTLMTMQYSSGIWEGYESETPFGGTFTPYNLKDQGGERGGQIYLYTPCQEPAFFSTSWVNTDGSVIIFVLLSNHTTDINGEVCDKRTAKPEDRCGNHDFRFGYVTAKEWKRVTGQSTARVEVGLAR